MEVSLSQVRYKLIFQRVELEQEQEDEEDYPHYYSDDWKTGDFKYWNKQTRELESDNQDLVRNMVVGLADRVSNAVNMIK